ncbi:MAG: hypothetical protein RSC73_02880, partial [Ruthenibacterium sp.]
KIFIVNRAAFVTLVDGYLYGMGYDVASTIGYNIYAVRLRVIGDTVQHTDPNGYNYNFAFAHNSNGGHTAMTYTTITSIGVLL